MIDMIPDLTVSANADEQGQYDVPLEPGGYEIRVTATNGFGRYEHIQLPSGQVLDISKKLEAGANLKIVAWDMLTHKPVPGVQFYIWDRGGGFMISEKKDSRRTTNANGQAEWDDLMPGDLEVDVTSDVYAQWWTDEMKNHGPQRFIDALRIEVSEGMAPVIVNLEPGVRATGTVVSPDGKPVLGAQVNIGGLRTGDQRYAKRTDGKGSFSLTFPGLNASFGNDDQPPKYAMVASDMQHRWANAVGEWFTPSPGLAVSASLKMTVGARLRGRVIGPDGNPVANVQVRAQAADGLDCQYYDPRGMTDDHGRFELGPMRAGNYSIYFAGDTRDIWQLRFPAQLKMDVAEGDLIEIGDVKYEGATPTLSPADRREMEQQGQHAVPETDDASWRRVAAVIVPPATQSLQARVQQPQEQTTDASPLEEPLPGTPAPAGHLSGQVVDAGGKPLNGVSITVWAKDHGDLTDVDGSFSLPSLPKDRAVEIRFSKEGYCPRFIPAQPAGLSGVNVILTNKTYFEGQVKDAGGKPVAGARIRGDQGVKQADRMTIPWVWTETSTDPQGNYRLYVQADTYDIQVRMPGVGVARTGKLPIADGQARHLDINLTAGITLSAHVVDSITNQPVAGVRLWSGENPGVEGRSDSSGNLVIPSMVPGIINFNVDAKGYTRWWSDAAAKEFERQPQVQNGQFQWNFGNIDFEITDGTPAAKFVVEREVTLRGKVVDPDGLPVKGATIGAVDTGSDRSISGDERFAVISRADGVFEMKLPASGDHGYNLIVHDGLRRAWRKWANGVIPIFRTKPGQELDDITIALTRPAVVRGSVVDADGKPVAGRVVRAIGSDLLEDINYEPSTRTDEKGNYEMKFVRPVSQMIQVAPFAAETSRAPEGTSKTVTLGEAQTLDGVNLTAMPGDEDK
jgi:protocatechuate 3,4-dioxygenase beta subunit